MVGQCVVPSCKARSSKTRPVKFYAVPAEKPRRQLWLDRLLFLRKYTNSQLHNVKFCEKHFAPQCFQLIYNTQRLSKNAFPTEHLHETDLEVISHDSDQVSTVVDLPGSSFSAERETAVEVISHDNYQLSTVANLLESSFSLDQSDIECETTVEVISHDNDRVSTVVNLSGSSFSVDPSDIIHDCERAVEEISHDNDPVSTVANLLKSSFSVGPTDIIHDHDYVCFPKTTDFTAHSSSRAPVNSPQISQQQCKSINKRMRNTTKKTGPKLCISAIDMTPRKRKLSKENRYLKAKLRLLKMKTRKQKTINQRFSNFIKKIPLLSNYGQILINSQIRLAGVEPKGRRYTSEEKVFALSLYKLSPKFYNELRKRIALPCKSKISSLLADIPLRPGINNFIFKHLSDSSKSKSVMDKQCILMFDEMAVQKGIFLNYSTGVIEGFEDCGKGQRNNNVADKALVFMLRGLASPWKIPIAFFFARDGVKKFKLKELIQDIIQATQKSGFCIRATVSDQGPANIGAINSLKSECRSHLIQTGRSSEEGPYYMVDGQKIYHIYDVPHLLKCFRNNFLKKDLLVGQKRAQWKHIVALYRVDGQHGMARSTKLTEKHINPQSYDKMKVKLAAQVFSRQVSTALSVYMKTRQEIEVIHCYGSSTAVGKDIENGIFTAEILKFINDLFDSLNGFGYRAGAYKAALSINSIHNEFWNSAVKMLEQMEFDASTTVEKKPITLKNFIEDIKSVKHLWADLISLNMKFLSLRRLNQDPLENFFSQIRGHCGYNDHPNCSQFVAAFKTLLINNITTGKSVFANCAADKDKMLGTIKNLIDQPKFSHYNETYDGSLESVEVIPANELQTHAVAYISGAVLRYLFPVTESGNCCDCKKSLIIETSNFHYHQLIESREYVAGKHLNYPSQHLMKLVWECIYTIEKLLPKVCNVYIYPDLIRAFQVLDISWFSCVDHKQSFFEKFWLFVIRMQVKQWCTNFNRRIHNVDSRSKTVEMEQLIATKVTKGASYRSQKRRKSQ